MKSMKGKNFDIYYPEVGSDDFTKIVEVKSMTIEPLEPCSHKGCLSHVTHPCEGCGRIAGEFFRDYNKTVKLHYDEQKKPFNLVGEEIKDIEYLHLKHGGKIPYEKYLKRG